MAAIEDRGVGDSMTRFGWVYLVIGLINIFLYLSSQFVGIELEKTAVAGFIWLFIQVLRYFMVESSDFSTTS